MMGFLLLQYVLLKFQVPDPEAPGEFKEVLDIGRREWLKEGDDGAIVCRWPSHITDPKKLKAFVTKSGPPADNWEVCDCEVVTTYSNYLDAHIGVKRRLEDADYETEKDLGRGRRRKKPRALSDSEPEASPVKRSKPLPPRPNFNTDAPGSNVAFQAGIRKLSPIKVVPASAGPSNSEVNNQKILKVVRKDRGTTAGNFDDFKKVLEAKKAKAAQVKEKIAANAVIATSPGWEAREENPREEELDSTFEVENPLTNDNDLFDETSTPLKRTETYITLSPVQPKKSVEEVKKDLFSLPSTSSHAVPLLGNFEKTVLQLLHEINQKTEVISTNQTKLNLNLLPNEKVLSKPEGMPTVPLRTADELREMEKALKGKEDLVSNLSTYLSTHVSKDVTKERASAQKVMAALLSNSVAKDYSLRGYKMKKAFDQLGIWTAVKGAILLKIETDLKETERGVQKWLADASWRKQSDGTDSRQVTKSPKKSLKSTPNKESKRTPKKSSKLSPQKSS